MGDENVVLYDETSPLEQSRKSILYYRPRQEETPTYLVELPEKRIDAPRPSTQPTSRPRRSTIVNTFQLPDSKEAEEQPLEDYVRRNISSFRKSLTPEDLQQLTTTKRAQEEEVVSPVTAEDIERDLMDSRKRKSRGIESVDDYERRESLPREIAQKQRVTYQSEASSEQTPQKHKDSKKFEDSQSSKTEKTKHKHGKLSANQKEHQRLRNEVVVMPALEPVSVSQKSPFNDQKPPSSKNRALPPVKVNLSLEPSDEDGLEDSKRGGNPNSKRGKSDLSSAKRKSSKESNESSSEEDYDRTKKKHKKRKHREKSETPTKDSEESRDLNKNPRRRKRNEKDSKDHSHHDETRKRKSFGSRSSSVCLSGDSGENSSEPHIVNRPVKKEKRPDKDRNKSPSLDENRSPRSSSKRERKSEDLSDYSQARNPFGKEDPYAVHFVTTKSAAGKKTGSGNNKKEAKKGKDSKEKKGGGAEGGNKKAAKAPRSATKVVAMRRYHIQIPEHGRPETWFNVRFNMNAENNVEMNYDGPVKINNYYASNNYA